jgi:uncharacterized membrane protein (DUF485 family)
MSIVLMVLIVLIGPFLGWLAGMVIGLAMSAVWLLGTAIWMAWICVTSLFRKRYQT